MRLMGEHMEGLAGAEEQQSAAAAEMQQAESPSTPRHVDPQQLQRWMSDPKVRSVLDDESTGRMLSDIQRDRSKFKKSDTHSHCAGLFFPPHTAALTFAPLVCWCGAQVCWRSPHHDAGACRHTAASSRVQTAIDQSLNLGKRCIAVVIALICCLIAASVSLLSTPLL